MLYDRIGRDSTQLDRSIKQGLRYALERVESKLVEDPWLASAEDVDSLHLCARLLKQTALDDERRLLDEMCTATVEQLRQMVKM